MTPTGEQPKRGDPIPSVAVGIVVVLCGLAIYQEVFREGVSEYVVGALVALAFGFAGYVGDRLGGGKR